MPFFAYVRVSSLKQEEDGTIESQIDAIKHHPSVRGEEIAEVYIDDGVSGYSKALWDRPGGSRLLKDAEQGKWEGYKLLVTRLNRLGRRGREIEEAIDRLLEYGVVVSSVKEGYEFDNQTPMGKFTRGLFASLAELDRNTIVDQTRDGMVRKAREGKLMPTYAYFGYDWTEVDNEGRKKPGAKLVINEKEANLVRTIFEKIDTMTTGALAKWLNNEGHKLPCKSPKRREKYGRTERLFSPKDIRDVLTRELYSGFNSWGKTTKIRGAKPEEFRHHWPELQVVTFEQFNNAARLLKERRRVSPKSQGSPYVYSGLLRCLKCGGKTVGKRQRHRSYDYQETKRYVCRTNHINGRTGCQGWSAYEQTVHKAVFPFLADLFENKLRIRDHLRQVAQEIQHESVDDRFQSKKAMIDEARRELVKIQEGFLADIFTSDEAQVKSLDARQRIENAERQLAELDAGNDLKKELAEAIRLLEVPFKEFIGFMPQQSVIRLCRAVFQEITIEATGVGRGRDASVVGYQFTPEIQQVLANSVHIESNAPAFEIVW